VGQDGILRGVGNPAGPPSGNCPRHYTSRLLLCVLFAAELACQKKVTGPPPRYAVLRFENLSGDPSLDWTGRAASETLPVSLAGELDGPMLPADALARLEQSLGARPPSAPGISTERQEAVLAGATRLIYGYVERSGSRICITASVEDLSSGKVERTVSAVDSSPLAALEQIARDFSPHARPAPTSSEAALRLYAVALESPAAAGIDELNQAIHLDPNFGAAWNAAVNLDLARADRAAALDAIDRAHRQKLDPLSLARLDLEAANLQQDSPVRIDALRKISLLTPADTTLLRTLAEAETNAGRFPDAVTDWRKLTVTFPEDPSTWNSLGYTLSYAGDYAGAQTALLEYARIRPKDPNASDSLGDLDYRFRKFGEAAAHYAQATKEQPDFERYGDLYKAAWARYNAGDKPGADALFAQFRAAREKLSDTLMPLVSADWLYRTGRKKEAVAALRMSLSGKAPEALVTNGYALLTIWDLLGHDRAQAAKDSLAMGPRIIDAPELIARFVALPSASAAEWKTRADHLIPPAVAAIRPLALGYALMFDGQGAAALPVWEMIASGRPATDFFTRAVYAHLQGKPPERPLVPDPAAFNQFLAVLE
jgi:tetratricopeptide (TPR) repeat protein